MKPTTSNSVGYTPGQAPDDSKEFQKYIYNELTKISAMLNALALGHLDETTVAPAKPRDGDVRFVDGVTFNPTGAGRGFYGYYSAAWHFLG